MTLLSMPPLSRPPVGQAKSTRAWMPRSMMSLMAAHISSTPCGHSPGWLAGSAANLVKVPLSSM